MSTTTATASIRTAQSGNIIARRTHALTQVSEYARTLHEAIGNPDASTVDAHLERAAYWACAARENGATEEQISAARQAGHAIGSPR